MKMALAQVKSLFQNRIFGNSDRPLLITDADEVILHFSDILAEYLLTRGMYVNFVSYSLDGNIKYLKNDKPVASHLFKSLIDDYFDKHVENQPLVKDSLIHLQNLSEICDILILSNIPHNFADRRRKLFTDSGLNYPMISSSGPKGPILKAIRAETRQKLIFIDDISHHHSSVAKDVPDCLRIQYIANDHLSEIEGKADDCHYRCDDWPHIEQVIRESLKNA